APVSARNLAAIETDKQPVPTTSSQWMRDHRPTPIKLAVSTHSPDSADANLTSIVTAPTVTPAATPIDQTTSPASSASTPPDAIQNPLTVEQHYTRFTQALSRNELNIAQTHLNALATLLPQESISLLRARAWYFSQAQDTSSARTTYEAILKRLPGDENAGLNLAALEAQAGRLPRAHSLLADVLRQHPDSVQAQQMRARLQEGRR
ncbi:MAG: tetratricopeptide repeat protein, partial [Sterolibacterium sp.]|nr:tetratricopeptide repeat protein [Sterolibacterium sp.]